MGCVECEKEMMIVDDEDQALSVLGITDDIITRDQVKEIISKSIDTKHIIGLAQLQQARSWCITLDHPDVVKKLLDDDKILDNIDLRSFDQQEVKGRVIWLPIQYPEEKIETALSVYGDVLELYREFEVIDGRKVYTGPRSFTICLKRKLSPDAVPHVMNFSKTFKGLIIIFGRQPLCLVCKKTGHISRLCPEKKKKENTQEKETDFNSTTYAEKLRIPETSTPLKNLQNPMELTRTSNPSLNTPDKTLASKWNKMETQISILKDFKSNLIDCVSKVDAIKTGKKKAQKFEKFLHSLNLENVKKRIHLKLDENLDHLEKFLEPKDSALAAYIASSIKAYSDLLDVSYT